MEVVQAVKKLNSISRDGRFCVQLSIETLCKRATSVAHLTNFSFEFFYTIFTEDASRLRLYHRAKKSKMTKNSNQGGSWLNPRRWCECFYSHDIDAIERKFLTKPWRWWECRKSWYLRDIRHWNIFSIIPEDGASHDFCARYVIEKVSSLILGHGARTASHDSGARYAMENIFAKILEMLWVPWVTMLAWNTWWKIF